MYAVVNRTSLWELCLFTCMMSRATFGCFDLLLPYQLWATTLIRGKKNKLIYLRYCRPHLLFHRQNNYRLTTKFSSSSMYRHRLSFAKDIDFHLLLNVQCVEMQKLIFWKLLVMSLLSGSFLSANYALNIKLVCTRMMKSFWPALHLV